MSRQTASFYNRIAFLYPLIEAFLRSQKRVLLREINRLPSGKLLEIGVGHGAHLAGYARHEVVGIDNSAAMLAIARKNNPSHAQLLEMNGETLEFPDQTFDYVVLSHVIAVVDDAEQVLREVHRVLKPHGRVFILNHFTPDNALKHLDSLVAALARVFYFKSVFRMQNLHALRAFTLVQETSLGIASYFKLLTYTKI